MNVCVHDSDGALFAKLEADVRRDVITLCTVVRSDGRGVVRTGAGARDIEPRSNNVNRLAEIDGDGRVVRRIETVRDRFGVCDPWPKLDDGRRLAF